MTIHQHLAGLPEGLGKAVDSTYHDVVDHFLREEWDDAQVDAGRFAEAVLRYLEWKTTGAYTPIDGKSKPNRARVTGAARNDTSLEASLRLQLPTIVELLMDFRNNRNSAHLGSIEANRMDANCVMQNASWVVGEIARLESQADPGIVQILIDRVAERQVPLVQTVGSTPVILDPTLTAADRALVLLYQHGEPVAIQTLRAWAEYSHATQWRRNVIGQLHKAKLVLLDENDQVHLLRPGEQRARRVLLAAGAVAA